MTDTAGLIAQTKSWNGDNSSLGKFIRQLGAALAAQAQEIERLTKWTIILAGQMRDEAEHRGAAEARVRELEAIIGREAETMAERIRAIRALRHIGREG